MPATSSNFGQTVTLTATAGPTSPGAGTPTGTVAFTVDGIPVGSAALSGATAAISTSSLSAGAHTITATYSGDANFTPSSSTLTYAVTCGVTITGSHAAG